MGCIQNNNAKGSNRSPPDYTKLVKGLDQTPSHMDTVERVTDSIVRSKSATCSESLILAENTSFKFAMTASDSRRVLIISGAPIDLVALLDGYLHVIARV